MIQCSKCKDVKEEGEFRKDKRIKRGYCSNCKECTSLRKRIYYQNNKEKKRERDRRYYQNNKDKIIERQRIYEFIEKEKRLKYKKEFHKKNKEKKRLYDKERYLLKKEQGYTPPKYNKELRKEYDRIRWLKKSGKIEEYKKAHHAYQCKKRMRRDAKLLTDSYIRHLYAKEYGKQIRSTLTDDEIRLRRELMALQRLQKQKQGENNAQTRES
jgi:hypothetical protein